MKRVCIFCSVALLLSLAVPAGAAIVWHENFEGFNGGVPGAGSTTAEAVPAGWTAWAQRGTVGGVQYGSGQAIISHISQEIDGTNPANFVQGVGNKLGTDASIEGANNYQLTLGTKPGGGGATYGGIYKIITGLPKNMTLTLDGGVRCRGGVGTTASGEIDVINYTAGVTPLPINGSDYSGTYVWKSVRTNANANGLGQWSDLSWGNTSTNHLGNGQFTTTTGSILLMIKVWSGSTLNNTTVYDFDDLKITPEPATLAFLGLGGVLLARRRRSI